MKVLVNAQGKDNTRVGGKTSKSADSDGTWVSHSSEEFDEEAGHNSSWTLETMSSEGSQEKAPKPPTRQDRRPPQPTSQAKQQATPKKQPLHPPPIQPPSPSPQMQRKAPSGSKLPPPVRPAAAKKQQGSDKTAPPRRPSTSEKPSVKVSGGPPPSVDTTNSSNKPGGHKRNGTQENQQLKKTEALEIEAEEETDNESVDDEEKSKNSLPVRRISVLPASGDFNNKLSSEDIEILGRLDEEYERALEEREIGYNARYSSVRQSAFLSVFFMVAYLFLGTAFFQRQTAWTIPDSLLFSIYTITTVGYGREDIPTTPGFQSYTIFYILVGIAALTIMVAQVYQCLALEASRAQHGRDKPEMARRGLDILANAQQQADAASRGNIHGDASADEIIAYHNDNMPGVIDSAFRWYDRAKHFFRNDEVGRSISVVFPFAGLILIGACVVGPLEGWSFLESVYFSVVSLTTVGFGDYVPTEIASIWFCVLWLPFSVGFMSLYLGNVAAFYIRLSDRNIQRIERQMRRRVERAKEKAEREREEVLRRAYRGQEEELEAIAAAADDDKPTLEEDAATKIPPQHAKSVVARGRRSKKRGFDALPTQDSMSDDGSEGHSLFGSTPLENMSGKRRQRILENSSASMGNARPDGRTMQSMRDIVRAVRRNLPANAPKKTSQETAAVVRTGPDVQFMSIRSTQTMPSNTMLRRQQRRKPSFALRVLLQERFAEIIATEIAGYQSSIEIKDQTLSVTIDSMQNTADKWLVPRRARKAFRAVTFEVLYFVGEHGLITRGADALYDLTPFEFHGLFSPLVAAMGDAETMEGWLASTDILADVDLRRDGTPRPGTTPSGENNRRAAVQQERLERLSNRNLNETLNHAKLKKISPGSAFKS